MRLFRRRPRPASTPCAGPCGCELIGNPPTSVALAVAWLDALAGKAATR